VTLYSSQSIKSTYKCGKHTGWHQLWLRLKTETKRYTFNTGNSQVKTVWFSLAFRLGGSWLHPLSNGNDYNTSRRTHVKNKQITEQCDEGHTADQPTRTAEDAHQRTSLSAQHLTESQQQKFLKIHVDHEICTEPLYATSNSTAQMLTICTITSVEFS